MIEKSLYAYLHYISIFSVLSCLVAELVLWSNKISEAVIKKTGKFDLLYGLGSILVVITGFLRIYNEKGMDYYFSNTIFLTKLGIFTLVGLLSIYPTIKFISWGKIIKKGDTPEISETVKNRISLIIKIEIFLMFLIPIGAVLMSRGINI